MKATVSSKHSIPSKRLGKGLIKSHMGQWMMQGDHQYNVILHHPLSDHFLSVPIRYSHKAAVWSPALLPHLH